MKYKYQMASAVVFLAIAFGLASNCNYTSSKVVFDPNVDPDAVAVQDILIQNCATCHMSGASQGGITLNSVDEIVALGLLNLENPKASQLYQAVETGRMPKGPGVLLEDELQTILVWIEKGAPSFTNPIDPVDPPPTVSRSSYKQELRCMLDDLYSVDERVAENYRYLQVFENAPRNQDAVHKLINSLSYNPVVSNPKSLCDGNVLRINLKDYNLKAQDWDDLIAKGKYPYAVKWDDDDTQARFHELEIEKLTRVKTIAFIRWDWFVFTASQPPFYYLLLDLPNSVKELEDLLQVDTQKQLIETYQAKRGILHASGVTNFNRIVDAYEVDHLSARIRFGTRYWKTFDVNKESVVDKKHFFTFPFGPDTTQIPPKLKGKVFNFDATELIWSLPNGFLGFYIADSKGNRIDEADTAIAVHPDNTAPFLGAAPGTVVAGVSCFSCHNAMNLFDEKGLKQITSSGGFNNEQLDEVRDLFFPNQQAVETALGLTEQAWSTAVVQTKLTVAKPVSQGQEAVFRTAKDYNAHLQVGKLANELYLSEPGLVERLTHDVNLAKILGFTTGDGYGFAARNNIEDLFANVIDALNLGTPLKFKGKPPVIVKPPIKPPPIKPPPKPIACVFQIKNNTPYFQRFDRFTFADQSYRQFYLNAGESRTFKHDSAPTFTGCLFGSHSSCVIKRNVQLIKCAAYQFQKSGAYFDFIRVN